MQGKGAITRLRFSVLFFHKRLTSTKPPACYSVWFLYMNCYLVFVKCFVTIWNLFYFCILNNLDALYVNSRFIYQNTFISCISVTHQNVSSLKYFCPFCLGQYKVHVAIQSRDMCIIIIILGFYMDYGLMLTETQRSSKVSLHTL